jgi:DNA-directed RNA polymerase subunit RPC12/RpoP
MTQSKRYEYSCAGCSSPVTKTPTGDGEKKGVKHGLHGWSCDSCGSGVKVSRKLK